MSWIYLSHNLSETTPLYNDSGVIKITPIRSTESGDSCNSSELSFPAHTGTHIDAPFHFDANGKTLDQYPADFWIASHPALIEIDVEPAKLITYDDIKVQLSNLPSPTDLLLIKTGAELWRNDGSDNYTKNGVGIDTNLSNWIRVNLNIKMIGFDFISLSSPKHREIGRLSHQALLADHESKKEPVLILEDLSLENLKKSPNKVFSLPLLFESSDGAIATVIAEE